MTSLSLEDQLSLALRKDDLPAVRSLIEAGADINGTGPNNTFPCVRYARSSQAVTLLVENGANVEKPDKYGETWLMSAARGFPELIEVLLRHGAQPDSGSPTDHKTALFHTGGNRGVKAIEPLFRGGANLDWQRYDGWTRLHSASISWEPDVVELLCRLGANVNLFNKEGNSPLHFAIKDFRPHNGTRVIEALLSAGADPDLTHRPDGYCPLHMAAYWNMTDAIRLLVSWGASTERKASEGETALDVALSRDAFESAALLKEKSL